MGTTLNPDDIPARRTRKTLEGHEVPTLGPSDSPDTGADMAGPGADVATGRVVGPEEAGLGGGLDEAEEAWLEQDRGEH